MTREQKLEAALHRALRFVANSVVTHESKTLLKEINEAITAPPTSEWNEAIEEVARSLVNDAEEFEGPDGFLFGVQPHLLHALDEALEKLDALKRKEQS